MKFLSKPCWRTILYVSIVEGSDTQKIAYVISKSFDFIEIKMISSDFNKDFRLQKSIKYVSDST